MSRKSLAKQLALPLTKRLKLDGLPAWVHGIALVGTGILLLIAVGIFWWGKEVPVWSDWKPAAELLHPEYGERIYPDSVFRTQMNTWSNFVYILFGFYALALGIYDWKRKWPLRRGYLTFAPMQTLLFGLTIIYLGLGSGFFHASLTHYGQQWDVGAMYATLIALVSFAFGSWLPKMRIPKTNQMLSTWPLLSLGIILGSVYFTYYKWEYSFTEISGYLSGILFLFAGLSAITPGKYLQFRWFFGGVVALVLGSRIRDLDIADQFTGPDSVFQGHAIWHVLTCVMYVCLFFYFRSEEREMSCES